MSWLVDLDGVVWRGAAAVPGSIEALKRLHGAGVRTVFVTNNSAKTATGYVEKLADMGVHVGVDDVVHGGHAVARLVSEGQRVLVCGGDGLIEALQEVGAVCIDARTDEAPSPTVDAVVVGWLPDFSVDLLTAAIRAVLNGARLIAPSADPLYPAHDGPRIGGGSLTMAVAYATKAEPTFAAKPFAPMVDVVRARVPDAALVVGDQAMTDGGLARALGIPFFHVSGGVGAPDPEATAVPDLAAAVDRWLEAR